MIEAKAAAWAAQRELARRSLLAFGELVYPKFEAPAHVRYIASLLEKLEAGEIRNLVIALPVRHGKSVICSQIFPAWYVGRHPDEPMILASHSESLAVAHSRVAKRIVEDPSYPFGAEMSSDSASVQRWNVTAGGGLYAVGAGGSITGRGSRLLVLDDLLHDALSDGERESVWTWFQEVAVPRLEPGGKILIVNARMASDDLWGRIEESGMASEFEFVSLPALAGENDRLGRKPGEALWPERISVEEIEKRRELMSPYAFDAQMQQDPAPRGGRLFRTEWFEQNRYETLPPYVNIVFQSIDSAWRASASADRSAIATLATDGRDIYIVDVWAGRAEYVDLRRIVYEQYLKHNPRLILVEEAASGFALVNELRRSTAIPIKGMKPGRESKAARAEAVTNWFEAGRIKWPRSAPWIHDALNEFLKFTGSENGKDDIVDAVVLGVSVVRTWITNRRANAAFAKQFRKLTIGR